MSSATGNWSYTLHLGLRLMRIQLSAAALKTYIGMRKYASEASVFPHTNKEFYGPVLPKTRRTGRYIGNTAEVTL